MHSLISYMVLPKFIQAFCSYRSIILKDDILILAVCLNDCSFKPLFRFHTLLTGNIQFISSPETTLTLYSGSMVFCSPELDLQKFFESL